VRRATVLLALGFVLALPGGAHAAAPRGCGPRGDHVYHLVWGGIPRIAVLHVPPRLAHKALPLIIALHGAGGDGPDFEEHSGLVPTSDDAGFAVVFPTAAGVRPFWNISRNPGGADDVGFIAALIDRLVRVGCADPARVYATGVSNGGGMAALLGCALSDRIAAVAPVAGGYKSLPLCVPQRPVSVLEIHGSRDQVVPYAGVPPDRLGSVPRFLVSWASLDGCSNVSQRQSIARATMSAIWPACRGGGRVEGIKLYGAGHEWPGGDPPEDDGPSDLSAARTVWAFFASVAAGGATG
jgi:polyhydroxybutyrate depolymerase